MIYLRRGLPTLPADQRDVHAAGLILAFVVDDLEGELARLQREGVAITMPLTVEEWGERAFQVRDPNGVIVQLVDWNGADPGAGYGVAVPGFTYDQLPQRVVFGVDAARTALAAEIDRLGARAGARDRLHA